MEHDSPKKLMKQVKQLNIQDEDVTDWEQVKSAFSEHYYPQVVSQFARAGGGGGKVGGTAPLCLYSDVFCNGVSKILCGFDDGICKSLDLNQLGNDCVLLDKKQDWIHKDLTCVRCSRTSPHNFYSSSSSDGVINCWDVRENTKKPCQKFSTDACGNSTKTGDKSKIKPLLSFDISCNDQLVCGGTEMVSEDSLLLFWDTRSVKLLGAYWESHSDDITTVKFHPNQVYSLASGSTDGLLNVFNLMEPEEDDSLQYSFNTNSSVDSTLWHLPNATKVSCVTHTNEFQIWDAVEGDRVAEFGRKSIADVMMRRNQESVYITSCHNLPDVDRVGILTCPLSGGNARLLELHDNKLSPRALFMDQIDVIQTAQILQNGRQWVTFDENRKLKVWKLQSGTNDEKSKSRQVLNDERRSKKRFKPYERK